MSIFRIHPAIGVARVGNSEEYIIAPETMAGSGPREMTGGLPIRANTEDETINSADLRDDDGALKRQAARFRIFAYPETAEECWPRGDGTEVKIDEPSPFDGRVVQDIIWTVHVANKKANSFWAVDSGDNAGIKSYNGTVPAIRNPDVPDPKADPNSGSETDKIALLNDKNRGRQLTIDPGPRTISGKGSPPVRFDRDTTASYYDADRSDVVALPDYPKSFPQDSFEHLDCPAGPIDTLGELSTDDSGRLLVLGGYGRAVGRRVNGPAPLTDNVNNNQWFDDTSDGPVSATLVFDDGSRQVVHGAWVTTTDPGYAPQILNVVSLWDDVYDCWVRELDLAPKIYDKAKGGYQRSYKPTFDDQIAPIFRSSALQQWVCNFSETGMAAHARVDAIEATDDASITELAGITAIFRKPAGYVDPGTTAKSGQATTTQPDAISTTQMPLHLGDGDEAFLTLRQTQYFFLQQWNKGFGHFSAGSHALGPGEHLDKATLVNCLGGRFSPGIDMTFVMREPTIFVQPWKTSGAGPFRIQAKSLRYASAGDTTTPFLTGGYIPRHTDKDGLEPGDLSKFMSIPWHTDYNSCATHLPDPNPPGNHTVFWSWPAQRPVAVYAAADVTWFKSDLPKSDPTKKYLRGQQRWSVRGAGTDATNAKDWGRYQNRLDILENWHRVGVVLQASAIAAKDWPEFPPGADKNLPNDWYLEAESQLVDTERTPVVPFPNVATMLDMENPAPGQLDIRDPGQLDPRDLFFKLLNAGDHPEVLIDARAYVDYWLKAAETFSNDHKICPVDQRFFPYSEQHLQDRLDLIYQELVDVAANSDPAINVNNWYFQTRDDMIIRIIQWAPFNLVDGSWLRNIGRTGPMDEVRGLLYSIFMDELGDGDVSQNHCNIYRDLCHSVGFYPHPLESREFAFDPRFLPSGFLIPAFQLAISQFTEDYYPEIIGMTLQLEWMVVDLKPTRDLLRYFGLDPHFYVMHIGIDNAVNGHGRRAADAVNMYLEDQRLKGGPEAVQDAWRRIWNGFVAFLSIPFDRKPTSFAEDLKYLVTHKPPLREQMIDMIKRKAAYGSRNHQQHTVGPTRIDEWFADPAGFLQALCDHAWITPGDWANSQLNKLLQFETGPMFRVFTDDEIALWAAYTESLAPPPSKAKPPKKSARETPKELAEMSPSEAAMFAVIEQLKPVQQGVPGHRQNMLADRHGKVHSLSWWFDEQPASALMDALASPLNGLITPGRPQDSRFYMELIEPAGPMGKVFDLRPTDEMFAGLADPPQTCREVVHDWIACMDLPERSTEGAGLVASELFTLRFSTPPAQRDRHPTGRMYGMGAVH